MTAVTGLLPRKTIRHREMTREWGKTVMAEKDERIAIRSGPMDSISPTHIDLLLWIAFAVMSTAVFMIGNTEEAMDRIPVFLGAGAVDAILAVVLLWRYGLSLAMPVVIAVYFFVNRWLLFYLFLSVIFWPRAAP